MHSERLILRWVSTRFLDETQFRKSVVHKFLELQPFQLEEKGLAAFEYQPLCFLKNISFFFILIPHFAKLVPRWNYHLLINIDYLFFLGFSGFS